MCQQVSGATQSPTCWSRKPRVWHVYFESCSKCTATRPGKMHGQSSSSASSQFAVRHSSTFCAFSLRLIVMHGPVFSSWFLQGYSKCLMKGWDISAISYRIPSFYIRLIAGFIGHLHLILQVTVTVHGSALSRAHHGTRLNLLSLGSRTVPMPQPQQFLADSCTTLLSLEDSM
jgi:hypothetical protein